MKNIFKKKKKHETDTRFILELSALETDFVDALIKLSDKYGEDRDKTIFNVSCLFDEIAETASFKNYEVE